ncbi:MAG: hypothetical protein ABIN24_06330 [Dyadobacter sp.]
MINKLYNIGKNVSTLFLVLIVLQSCNSEKFNFAVSSVVPAAEGSVEVKKDGNENYEIELNISRLAEPERLSPKKKFYVVWVQTENSGDKNIGQLKTSSGFLSSTLKSSLSTVTPFKPLGFLISAEDNIDVQHPGEQIVLRTTLD